MKDLIVKLSEQLEGKTKEELSPVLDQEIEDFSAYMCTLGDWKAAGPLNHLERALLKTYLINKLAGRVDGSK